MVQLSYLQITTRKIAALIIWTFPGKLMSPILDALSSFVIAFLPRRKRLLIPCLQSPSAVISEASKRKFGTVSTFPPSICHQVMGQDAMI